MRRLVPLLVLLAAASAAPPAQAGGLALSPSRLEAQVVRGGLTPPIQLRNGGLRPVEVRVQALPARADLNGQPIYEDTAAGRRRGRTLLRVTPARFVLRPGERRDVRARVLTCPQVGLGTYAVMNFTARERSRDGARNVVQPALRLTSTLLLAHRPSYCTDGAVTGLRADQVAAGRIAFLARVRNDGDLHTKPSAGLELRRGERVVFRGRFPYENVLPKSAREIALPLTTKLGAGEYVATARVRVGRKLTRTTARIRLTGQNELPQARLALAPLAVDRFEPGEVPTVTAAVRNSGTGAGAGRVRFSLRPERASSALETKLVGTGRVPAGDDRDVAARLSPLPEGTYQVEAELLVDGRSAGVRRLNVDVAPPGALVDRLRDWIADRLPAALAIAALLLAAAIDAVLRFPVARRLAGVLRRVAARTRRRPEPGPVLTEVPAADELAEIRRALARLEARATEIEPGQLEPVPAAVAAAPAQAALGAAPGPLLAAPRQAPVAEPAVAAGPAAPRGVASESRPERVAVSHATPEAQRAPAAPYGVTPQPAPGPARPPGAAHPAPPVPGPRSAGLHAGAAPASVPSLSVLLAETGAQVARRLARRVAAARTEARRRR